jgi:hypothetical protein
MAGGGDGRAVGVMDQQAAVMDQQAAVMDEQAR